MVANVRPDRGVALQRRETWLAATVSRCARAWLLLFSHIYRRFPWLPGRLLRAAGFDVFGNSLRSRFWARCGHQVAPIFKEKLPMLLDMGECHHRYAFITGRCPDFHVELWLRNALDHGGLFIDVGANIGWFTALAATLVGTSGRVLSIEPNTSNFALLTKNCCLNRFNNVKLFPVALGARPGEANLSNADGPNPLSSLRPAGDPSVSRAATVQVVPGDTLLADIPSSARGACKIDVEGFELEVVRGMRTFISAHREFQFCIEITDEWICACSKEGVEALVQEFVDLGFRAYQLRRDGTLSALHVPPAEQMDVVFNVSARAFGQCLRQPD